MSTPANNHDGLSVEAKLDLLLAEQKQVLQQLGRLTAELRTRKLRCAKRTRTVRERSSERLIAETKPSELDVARAQRILARQQRRK